MHFATDKKLFDLCARICFRFYTNQDFEFIQHRKREKHVTI